jgi:hypothetical protein
MKEAMYYLAYPNFKDRCSNIISSFSPFVPHERVGLLFRKKIVDDRKMSFRGGVHCT